MKILIIGGDGMLGHQLLSSLQHKHDVRVTLRQDLAAYQQYGLFHAENSYAGIDVRRAEDLIPVMADFNPQAVINAGGVVKQRQAAKEVIPSLEINALFPHRLALLCKMVGARMIQFSTDCIFSGKQGQYTENDPSDAEDIYGKSKYLGEVHEPHCLTLRAPFIGLELSRNTALVEWFLAQRGKIKGFTRAIYSGLTTIELSRVVEKILLEFPDLTGLWHISSAAINKYELLRIFSQLLERDDVQIEADDHFSCDRSLASQRFIAATGYKAPSWPDMLSELTTQIKKRDRILCY